MRKRYYNSSSTDIELDVIDGDVIGPGRFSIILVKSFSEMIAAISGDDGLVKWDSFIINNNINISNLFFDGVIWNNNKNSNYIGALFFRNNTNVLSVYSIYWDGKNKSWILDIDR